MIDTRLCKSEEELLLAMQYEKDKVLLSQHQSKLFKLKAQLQNLNYLISYEQSSINKLEKNINNFKKQYDYIIVKEKEGGDVSYLTTKS
jgi:cob(I)alamin adenosyltransferase